MKRFCFLLIAAFVFSQSPAQQFYNVLNYGAKSDSSKIATKAIAAAITIKSTIASASVFDITCCTPDECYQTGSLG